MATTGILLRKGSTGEQVRQLQKALHLLDDGIFGVLTEEAVKDYQRENHLTPDGIVGTKTWESLFGKVEHPKEKAFVLKKSKRRINAIIVHCSDTPEGRPHTVADIRSWHIKKGYGDVGYHYVVYIDGSLHEGRDVDLVGAHCRAGGQNPHSIGVCYVGGCEGEVKNGKIVPKENERGHHIPKDTRTTAQKEALLNLLNGLRVLYPCAKIYGHHDFEKGKACPSFDAKTEYRNI